MLICTIENYSPELNHLQAQKSISKSLDGEPNLW